MEGEGPEGTGLGGEGGGRGEDASRVREDMV